jgi:hypothetical protein
MTWIEEHKGIWRVTIIVLLLVSLIGPWVYDQIWVPSDYTCSAPFIRLDGDFCGTPKSGIWLYRWIIGGLIEGLVTGEFVFSDVIREFLMSSLFFLPFLPVVSTAHMILRGDRKPWRIVNILVWGLIVGLILVWGLSSYPKLFWVLWGIWLYILLAASGLILEVLTLAKGRKSSVG